MSVGWCIAIGLVCTSGLRWIRRPAQAKVKADSSAESISTLPAGWDDISRQLAEIEIGLECQGRRLEQGCSVVARGARSSAEPMAAFQLCAAEAEVLRQKLKLVRTTLHEHVSNLDQFFKEARTDGLTGLLNRRAFDEHLARQYAIFERYGTRYSLVMFDLDHFKELNDALGHQAGDEALRQFARILSEGVRAADLVARYGGEEFALLLPQTGAVGAMIIAERIRQRVEDFQFQIAGQEIELRISAGVATTSERDDLSDIVARSDAALYESKATGRNRIHLHTGSGLKEISAAALTKITQSEPARTDQAADA
jgi:diguanylate cyclase (GGDEF)-like protein